MSFKLWMEVSSGNILLTQLLATLIKSYYKLPLQYMPRTRPLNNFRCLTSKLDILLKENFWVSNIQARAPTEAVILNRSLKIILKI